MFGHKNSKSLNAFINSREMAKAKGCLGSIMKKPFFAHFYTKQHATKATNEGPYKTKMTQNGIKIGQTRQK